ncbi:hypothetical protein CRENBAI_017077 [Crenichthys baileyi]|uniref:Uncharacterized protein n=1 Tax=Crenichthys baileyi TaxID=28760 RepID=A0AAV9RAX5_9TELE
MDTPKPIDQYVNLNLKSLDYSGLRAAEQPAQHVISGDLEPSCQNIVIETPDSPAEHILPGTIEPFLQDMVIETPDSPAKHILPGTMEPLSQDIIETPESPAEHILPGTMEPSSQDIIIETPDTPAEHILPGTMEPSSQDIILETPDRCTRPGTVEPLSQDTKLARLDKHLIDHHSMWEYEDRQPVLEDAKRAEIIKQLAVLRGSEPEKPMVSTLDIVSTAQPELVLKDFKACHMAKHAGKTRLTNSQQAENHAKQFCYYMLNESPSSAGHKDLTFLYQMDKLYSFPRSLAVQGYAPSTIQKRLCNVIMFLKHIESNFQKPSKLTHEQQSEISDEIKRLKAQLVSKEAVYQQESWHRMTENFTAVETEFLIVAQQKIPVLLKHIHNSPNVMADHNKLMGYMMGYFAIQTRNSLVKLANMIKDNVNSAKSSMDKRFFWVEVNEKKSIHSSGQPVLFLSLKEYLWLDLLINTCCCHQASQCQYVFHTVFGNKISIPGTLLRAACIDSGIETSTFMSSEQRQQLERFISCYSQLEPLNSPTQCPTEGNHNDVVEDLSLKDGELRKRNDRHQEEEDTKMDNVPELAESDNSPLPCGQTFAESEVPTSSSTNPRDSPTPKEDTEGEGIYSREFQEILSRLDKLEQSLNIIQTQETTPAKRRKKHPTFGSAQKGEFVDKISKSSYLYEIVLKDFERFRVGARTGRRDLDNAHQSRSHAKRFCLYMLGGMPSFAGQQDLTFLDRMEKLRSFPQYMANKGYAPTTIKNMLCSVVLFLKHVELSFQKDSKLSQKQLSKILYEIKRLQSHVMKKVDEHKTVRSFGQAALFLSKEEYGWLERLIQTSCCTMASRCEFVFHTVNGNQIFKPVNLLQEVWVDAGLKGTVTFTQIRSSVSTQVNKSLSTEERQRVAKAMCHDTNTAERFYVSLPDKVSGYATRKLRMKALKMSALQSTNDDSPDDEAELPQEECESNTTEETTTEDEEESQVTYDDSEMCSASSPSDDENMRKENVEQAYNNSKFHLELSDSELESESPTTSRVDQSNAGKILE